MNITPAQMVSMTLDYIKDLENAQRELDESLHNEARKEQAYRVARGKAWSQAEGRTGDERVDHVNAMTAAERLERDLAVATSKAKMELVRNKRQSMSAIQTAANSIKEEAAFSRVGPDVTDSGPGPSLMERERYGIK